MTLFADLPENASRTYRVLCEVANERSLVCRDYCEDLWRDFAPLADPHFVAQFALQTHARWFEMYLTVALIRRGYDVQAPKPGPDILLTIDGRRIWIEATCATAGEPGRPDSVPPPRYFTAGEQPEMQDVPVTEMTLRLRNSLEAKQQQFTEYARQGIVRPEDLSVVAINVYDVPHAWADMNALMRRALYGLGHPMIAIDRITRKSEFAGYQRQPVIAKKSTGEAVAVEPFVDGSMPHIAAVIGSREDVGNAPPHLGMGLSLYPNVSTAALWPTGVIRLGEEWVPQSVQDGGLDLNLRSYRP